MKSLLALVVMGTAVALACADACYNSGYSYSAPYYGAQQSYCAPSYNYTYYPAGNYGGYYYKAGYYRYYGGQWYLQGYGAYYPQSVYPTLYLPTTYRTAFFGTYVPPDVAQAYGQAYSGSLQQTTTTTTATQLGAGATAQAASIAARTNSSGVGYSSPPENSAAMSRMLTLVEQIAIDVQGTKTKVSAIESDLALLKKRVYDLETGKTNPNPTGPPPPIPSGEKEKPAPAIPRVDPPKKSASISLEAHTELKNACAGCHKRGELHKDTKLTLFNGAGMLLLMSPTMKSKMLERIVEGTMPPKDSPNQLTAKGKIAVMAWLAESSLLERKRIRVSR